MKNKIFPATKKSSTSEVKYQDNADCVFDIEGILHQKFVLRGQKVNQVFYKDLLIHLREEIAKNAQKSDEQEPGFFTTTMRQ